MGIGMNVIVKSAKKLKAYMKNTSGTKTIKKNKNI